MPAHLERVLLRLTDARARGTVGAGFDDLIDRVARELDEARAGAKSLRGEARKGVIARLEALDAALGEQARGGLDEGLRSSLEQEAADDLSSYRAAMAPEAYDRALAAAVDRLTRERLGLPTITY